MKNTIDFTSDILIFNRVCRCTFTGLKENELKAFNRFNKEVEKFADSEISENNRLLITLSAKDWKVLINIFRSEKDNFNCQNLADIIEESILIDNVMNDFIPTEKTENSTESADVTEENKMEVEKMKKSTESNLIVESENNVKNESTNVDVTGNTENSEVEKMENDNIYRICADIMKNSSKKTFYPSKLENDKNGKCIAKNCAENIVHNDESGNIRKVYTDNRKVNLHKLAENVKICEIVEFLKREYKKNPNNFSVSVERVSMLRINVADGSFITGKKENYTLQEVASAVAVFVLNHNCKNGKMLQIHVVMNNNIKTYVINTVRFIPNFYTSTDNVTENKNSITSEEKTINQLYKVAENGKISKTEILAIVQKMVEFYNKDNSIDKLSVNCEIFGCGKKVE